MIQNRIIFNDATDFVFNLKKAEGSFIWTTEGKKLIDFTSGWNVTNLGWNNPEIAEAMKKQLERNAHNVLWSSDETQIEYANSLCNSLPQELDTIARATGGTEANEEAIKTARAFTKRKKIIGFKNTYHGQSFATMSIGYPTEYTEDIAPLVPDFIQIDFPGNNLNDFANKLEELLSTKEIAAVVCEAGIITGWGSTLVAPDGFVKLIRELTQKYGTLMILDEVGTGFSRCGKLYGMEIEGVVPDIVTFAKGMSNGAGAIGAMVTKKVIAENTDGKCNLTSTFGWNPVACAAAQKTLEIHKRDKVWEKSKNDGNYIRDVLYTKLSSYPKFGCVRGLGMEIGLELKDVESAKRLVKNAAENNLHLVLGDGANIQIMPPLTIEREVLDEGLEILVKSVEKI